MTGFTPTIRRVDGDPARHEPEHWNGSAPEASVVLAIYNAERYLDGLLQNLRDLDHGSFEVVLVDDGSSDSTIERLGAVETLPFPLLVLSLAENHGVAAARNLALAHVSGRHVWMVDGDDRWPATALSSLCQAAQTSGAELVIAQATRIVAGSGRATRIPAPATAGVLDQAGLVAAYLSGDIQGQLWNKLFARELLVGHGDVFPRVPSKSDVCGLISIIGRVRKAAVISEDVYTYEFHSGSIATSKAKPLDLLRVAELTFREFGGSSQQKDLLNLFWLRSVAIPLLTEVWRFNDRSDAARYAVRVVRSGLGVRAAVSLLASRRPRDAAWAFALKYASSVVRASYIRRRRSEWA